MIIKKITSNKTNDRELILFFSGWGMDEHPFIEYLPADKDCMICYNYGSLSFDLTLMSQYESISVVAWSMGVWAASRILSGNQLNISNSVAINGTPWPVDNERGIPENIFDGTYKGLNEMTLNKFRRRMCSSKEAFLHFMEHAPQRTVEDLRDELLNIRKLSVTVSESVFNWDKIYIGQHDKIFIPANQCKAWAGRNIIMLTCGHYPDNMWHKFFNEGNHE